MNHLEVRMHDSPDVAPKYNAPEFKAASLEIAHVVGRGTNNGNPTVDLVFIDANGQQYVAMITGGIIQNLAGCVSGMKQRTEDQDKVSS